MSGVSFYTERMTVVVVIRRELISIGVLLSNRIRRWYWLACDGVRAWCSRGRCRARATRVRRGTTGSWDYDNDYVEIFIVLCVIPIDNSSMMHCV